MYLAFYRTFRPSTFDEVVRQEHIVRILKNQIASDKVGHAYLFCGPRGTGKTTLAKIFARAINCEHPVNSSPCGKCATCKALSEGSNLDISEIDAASNNGVDEMRDLREKVQYPPVAGRYKVYIIDEVHMLTQSAFNAVLKTLEEPPRHAVFILATTEPQKIPATILSRCMRFDFKLIPQADLEELIKSVLKKSGKEYEDAAVSAIARAGAGSARDSLSIADMCASYSQGKLTYDDVNAVLGGAEWAKVAHICGSILKEDLNSALSAVEEALATGKSVGVLLKDMLSFLNDCAIVKVCKTAREIVNLPDDTYRIIEGVATAADGHKLMRVTEILSQAETDMRFSVNGKITLETAIMKASMPSCDYDLDALIGKINELERKINSGVPVKVDAGKPPFAASAATAAASAAPAATAAASHTLAAASPTPAAVSSAPFAATPTPAAEPRKKIELKGEDFDPFANASAVRREVKDTVQPQLFDEMEVKPTAGKLNGKVFAQFIKSLRTTHKNAVLFTLCMDLENAFEGDKFVLLTESEAVFKSLTRAENSKFISAALSELGVFDFEIRLKQKGESGYERALKELKNNFEGIDIDIK